MRCYGTWLVLLTVLSIIREVEKNMNKQKALEKLKKSKREALANSSEIKVGRLELNEAMKALRTIIALENVINNK